MLTSDCVKPWVKNAPPSYFCRRWLLTQLHSESSRSWGFICYMLSFGEYWGKQLRAEGWKCLMVVRTPVLREGRLLAVPIAVRTALRSCCVCRHGCTSAAAPEDGESSFKWEISESSRKQLSDASWAQVLEDLNLEGCNYLEVRVTKIVHGLHPRPQWSWRCAGLTEVESSL